MSEETLSMLKDNVHGTADGLSDLFGYMYADEYTREEWAKLVEYGIVDSQDWPHEEGTETADADVVDDTRTVEEVQEAIREHLLDWPLEIVEHGTRQPGGEWETSHVVIVFGTGGPHVEYDGSKGRIVGYWSGETAYASAPDGIEEFYGYGD